MRRIFQGIIVAGCLAAFSGPAAMAAPLNGESNPGTAIQESPLQTVQSDSYCSRLRYRCENKEDLGQEGYGNCRRYREECGEWQRRRAYCARLRYKCEHKEDLGQEGYGNCRRYRSDCGGY